MNTTIKNIEYPSVRKTYGLETYMIYKHTINKKLKYKIYEPIRIGYKIYKKSS